MEISSKYLELHKILFNEFISLLQTFINVLCYLRKTLILSENN